MITDTEVSVLIVEDSPTQAAQLQRTLESHDFAVTAARTGAEALEILKTEVPTLVITDVVMPGMTGYELCSRIKADERLREIPVLLLTSLSDPKDVIKGLQCAADSFIVKPYEDTALFARIQYILANLQLRRQTSSQMGIEILFGGQKHLIRSERIQMVDLLLSTYETAVQKNLALSRAKEEADRANRAKSEFLSRMSHELRTPLNAILGFAQVLQMDAKSPDDEESIDHILRAGRHLLDLINEVLDISRIEAGRVSIVPERVDAADLMKDCIALIQPLAQKRGIAVEDQFTTAAEHHVKADPQRLKQVFINLLSNAVKYNRESGTITVWFEADGERLRINIRDSGTGISPADAERLFTPFERLQVDNRTEVEGSWLGLALSKRLVELMGGSIGLESELGEGTVFWAELPRLEARAGAGRDRKDQSASAAGRYAATVLHIEDDLSITRLVEQILSRRSGIKTMAAMQGGLGLELARQRQPDVILLDLELPDMRGEEVLKRLQNDPLTSAIPVLIISVVRDADHISRLLGAGARGYLSKPLDLPKFLSAVDELLPAARVPSS